MLNCHAKKMNWKDQAFLEKFFVIESSTLTGWEHFWATRFFVMWGWGLHPHQSKNSKISSYQKLPPPPSTPNPLPPCMHLLWFYASDKMDLHLDAVPFCGNYAKLYLDAKQLDWTGSLGAHFLKKSILFGHYQMLH